MDRFSGDVDWSGYEIARANLWHRQLHIFLHPFYYIEYGIAQLGALQVWANSKRDKAKALDDYKKSLALGGSRPLPELFQAAGCQFEFSERTIQPLAKMLQEELASFRIQAVNYESGIELPSPKEHPGRSCNQSTVQPILMLGGWLMVTQYFLL